MFLSELTEIVGKAFQRIMLGADRPNDLIERLNRAARRARDASDPELDLRRILAGVFRPVR